MIQITIKFVNNHKSWNKQVSKVMSKNNMTGATSSTRKHCAHVYFVQLRQFRDSWPQDLKTMSLSEATTASLQLGR